MASPPPPLPPTPPGAPPAGRPRKSEITLVSHSQLFYWWPIWLFGYAFVILTYMEDTRLAHVPATADVRIDPDKNADGTPKSYVIVVPADKATKDVKEAAALPADSKDKDFRTRVSQRAWVGPLYCVILLLTIVVTNVPLRGLWSFLVILLVVLVALILALVPGGWDDLLRATGNLHIYINMAGYLFIATAVLVLWAVSFFIFDQRTYMKVTPGQIQVCEHIGAAVRNFDTTGMAFEKQRDDIFRHWVLGFFSGDLIVKTSGAERETIKMPNVLWISWRLQEVQEILREKAVVSGTSGS